MGGGKFPYSGQKMFHFSSLSGDSRLVVGGLGKDVGGLVARKDEDRLLRELKAVGGVEKIILCLSASGDAVHGSGIRKESVPFHLSSLSLPSPFLHLAYHFHSSLTPPSFPFNLRRPFAVTIFLVSWLMVKIARFKTCLRLVVIVMFCVQSPDQHSCFPAAKF